MHWRSGFSTLLAILVSGCAADYLNNYDWVTLAAGDANHTNVLLQTVDPPTQTATTPTLMATAPARWPPSMRIGAWRRPAAPTWIAQAAKETIQL
ncbi:hypothetical protein [Mesorhizobium sp. L2C084A000]|uniref:hypothetical protein n=1 Tax=Mesorhizobium sp. L2C084A000 TaxID=1287116 RepID=UPI001FDA05CA|nr:hypothetical protein [Mesorhizobium sp. L2C084A000]